MRYLDRRAFLRAGLAVAGAGLLGECAPNPEIPGGLVLPTDPRVAAVEAGRHATGVVSSHRISAEVAEVDLGGPRVTTWTYGGVLPGSEIRVRAGDTVQADVSSRLPVDTTVHWHGLAIRNDMDGAHAITRNAISPGGVFQYRFIAATPGTHWFHPHVGTQLDRGLYAPLIVEDPGEPGDYDQDWTVVLDDWVDGTGTDPEAVLARLRARRGGMGGMGGMGGSSLGGAVAYPYYLINGRVPAAPVTFTGRPGQRARIRLINAGSDTAFRVALGGGRLRITHTDGMPVRPVDADALVIGMGERYDVLTTLGDGVFPLVALAEGKDAIALALIRTGGGSPPPSSVRPGELAGDVAGYRDLVAAEAVRLPARTPDIEQVIDLTGGMMNYDWGINGQAFDPARRLGVHEGQRVRLTFRNRTMTWHPMHLHGHTFQLDAGPRKDTVIVLPGQTIGCDLNADNPGQWMLHCHNTYHAETGMATILGYRT